MDVMEEILEQPTDGSIRITSLIKLVHLIKHTGMIMELDAAIKLNAKNVNSKDARLSNILKYIQWEITEWF